ncbi:cobalamin-binding protein [uncultured Nocardioides sp.]|uniref:cobalamin-binding protein n=1 Tax=uncultured Nocardioides sp. TaxID=198441 RepID=UPI00262AB682|nr:cobalamin-binding protein [uncultured Nocardioides sp.]
MRIVSLLPSTTEILFALGVGEDVVGVTFECDFPAEARGRRVVSGTTMPEGLDPAGIDAWVAAATAAGEDLYTLDAGALSDLDPDLVLTQDLCAVCAIDVDTVDDALAHLGCRAEVLSFDPHTIAEIADSVRAIGRAVGRKQEAEQLAATVDALDAARAQAGTTRPRVVVLEWTDPPYAPGHWIPEMVEAAGGECVLGTAGARSVRTTWDEVAAARPDLVVVAPCGFDREGARAQERALLAAGVLPTGVPTYAVDANAHWARPGPRIVEGVEDLRTALGRPREGALGRPSW